MQRIALAIFALALSVASAVAQGISFPVPSIQLPIVGTVATITKILTAVPGKQIVVTSLVLGPAAGSVVTFTYGTGTNCATNPVVLTGPMVFAAGALAAGDGNGPIMILPTNTDLCITIGTAVAPGTLVYTLVP